MRGTFLWWIVPVMGFNQPGLLKRHESASVVICYYFCLYFKPSVKCGKGCLRLTVCGDAARYTGWKMTGIYPSRTFWSSLRGRYMPRNVPRWARGRVCSTHKGGTASWWLCTGLARQWHYNWIASWGMICGAGNWTKGLSWARLAPYHWAIAPTL